MIRRIVALGVIFCLLVVACVAGAPAKVTLVCRMTGRAMTPVASTAATRHSCCAVAVAESADGIQFSLTKPGCCDLHFSARGDVPLASSPTAPDHSMFAVWAPAPPTLYTVAIAPVAARYLIANHDAPRGPPPRSTASRAPPFFS